jgi:hypothetical protein
VPSESPRESAFTTYTNEEVVGPVTYHAPIAESQANRVLPYRGVEYHGVDPGKVMPVEDTDSEGGSVVTDYFVQGTDDIDPVPVRIVESATHEYSQWRAWQVSVPTVSPVLVGGLKNGRKTLKVRSLAASGGNRIWVGPDSNVSAVTGYPIDPGAEMAFSGEAPVWAIAETGLVMVALFTEFSTAE